MTMGKVTFDISMSLDGFITASNRRPEQPMGVGGERLHEWAFGGEDKRDREALERGIHTTGAVIAGRRTYDDSIPWWGPDGPTGSVRLPLFVVSHSVPNDVPEGSVYTFVEGIEPALARAQEAAGGKNVNIMGGADIAQQYLRAGLVDEISIHLVPVVFGSGLRLFEQLGNEHIQLETIEVIHTAAATHLRYRVLK
jgi:dihydrofolate reductase